jgi:hypothetical protein
MKLDPGMHIGMHLVSFGKSGVTLCSVAGFTNEDPKKAPPYVGRFLLIEACDRHNRSRRVGIQYVVGGTAINVKK